MCRPTDLTVISVCKTCQKNDVLCSDIVMLILPQLIHVTILFDKENTAHPFHPEHRLSSILT